MSVPIVLPDGVVLIYKIGNVVSPSGMRTELDFKFASIYQVWAGGETFVYGGETVLYNSKDSVCRLSWDGDYYTMIEYDKIRGIDR